LKKGKLFILVFALIGVLLIAGCQQYLGKQAVGFIGEQTATDQTATDSNQNDTELLLKMDHNYNGEIDQGDVDRFLEVFRKKDYYSLARQWEHDYNGDRKLDNDDFFLLAENFGKKIPTRIVVYLDEGEAKSIDTPLGVKSLGLLKVDPRGFANTMVGEYNPESVGGMKIIYGGGNVNTHVKFILDYPKDYKFPLRYRRAEIICQYTDKDKGVVSLNGAFGAGGCYLESELQDEATIYCQQIPLECSDRYRNDKKGCSVASLKPEDECSLQ